MTPTHAHGDLRLWRRCGGLPVCVCGSLSSWSRAAGQQASPKAGRLPSNGEAAPSCLARPQPSAPPPPTGGHESTLWQGASRDERWHRHPTTYCCGTKVDCHCTLGPCLCGIAAAWWAMVTPCSMARVLCTGYLRVRVRVRFGITAVHWIGGLAGRLRRGPKRERGLQRRDRIPAPAGAGTRSLIGPSRHLWII